MQDDRDVDREVDRDMDKEVEHVTQAQATEDETEAESTKGLGTAGMAPHMEKWSMFDLIHPNEVFKALRQFVEDHREPPK